MHIDSSIQGSDNSTSHQRTWLILDLKQIITIKNTPPTSNMVAYTGLEKISIR